MTTWQNTLARSTDLSGVAGLPYAFNLALVFNRPGTYTATLPLYDDVARKVSLHSTCVVCQRNNDEVWSGRITNVVKDAAARTMQITAQGWLEELDHRFARAAEEASLIFTGVTGGNILAAMLDVVNSQQDSSGVARPTHLSFAQALDTQVRTRSYKRGQNYGQAAQELVDVENGMDVYVDPRARAITTRAPTDFPDHTGVLFGYNALTDNLESFTEDDDGTQTANRYTAVGANGVAVPVDDSQAINTAGLMMEDWQALSDVADSIIVGAYANAELVYRRYGRVTYTFKPKDDAAHVLRPFEHYVLGGKVYLSADAGALQVERQAARVFSLTVDGDDQGNENVSEIGTAPA